MWILHLVLFLSTAEPGAGPYRDVFRPYASEAACLTDAERFDFDPTARPIPEDPDWRVLIDRCERAPAHAASA